MGSITRERRNFLISKLLMNVDQSAIYKEKVNETVQEFTVDLYKLSFFNLH